MSFILDALKKSEAERLRKDTPGFANIPESGRQKSSTKWVWLVLALVTVNLVVLAVLMLKVEQDSDSAAVPGAENNTQARSAAVVTPPIVTAVARDDEPIITNVRSETGIDESTAVPPVTRLAATEIAANAQAGTVGSGLESFNDLRAKGAFVLPDMHLDIHVYSGNAADRFVFVNMAKYKENATLAEGPSVAEIVPDGVILNYQGTSFLLPRE